MRVTIKDVAKVAGVSTATVSMVINNKADHISQKTKDTVLKAIEKLDYHPNATARSLVMSQSKTIGLLIPDITNPFFAELAKRLEEQLMREGYITFLGNSGDDKEQEGRYIEEMASRSVDGIIICGLSKGSGDKLSLLKRKRIPYVILDNRVSQDKFAIKVDDYEGGKLVANYLLGLNHDVVAFAGNKSDYYNIWNRYNGFSEVLVEAGKRILLFETELTKKGGMKIAEELFCSDATAVFCGNDLIAVGIYERARKFHIKLPKQLSIVGFDDMSFADIVVPNLTTVKQPMDKIAEISVKQLLQMIKEKDYEFDEVVVPVELIIRESSIEYEE